MSQKELSRKAGIDRSQLADIERGAAEPKIGTLRAIAGALGIPVSELLRGIKDFD